MDKVLEKNYKFQDKIGNPFIIKSNGFDSVDILAQWIKENDKFIKEKISTYGIILFRDFKIKEASDFEKIALSIDSDLCDSHPFDDGPRVWLTKYVYEASVSKIEKAPNPLPFHNEDSYTPYVPSNLMFCSIKPAMKGGESLMVDCRKVLQDIPEKTKKKFLNKEVQLQIILDDSTFLVNSRIQKNDSEIYKFAKKYGALKIKRLGNKTEFLFKVPAIINHNNTPIWFSRAHQASILSYIIDIWNTIKYQKLSFDTFGLISTIFNCVGKFVKFKVMDMLQGNQNWCRLNDNVNISVLDQIRINKAFWKNAMILSLKKGDVLFLDNRIIAHGRMPYKEKRILLSCMGSLVRVDKYTGSV